jgi:hypothetical protein
LCDGVFVCDAFGSAHRAHASVMGITRFVKQAAAGLLMEKELAYLGKAVTNPARPFVAILGGAKVSDKIEVVENLMKIADAMLIGGGMAYTFEKAEGFPIGKSLVENDKIDLAKRLLAEAQAKKFKFLLPSDHVVAPELKPDAKASVCDVSATFLRCRRLLRARWSWRKRLPRRPPRVLLPLWVGEIRWRRCISLEWPTKFRIFPRAAGLRWNFLADGSCLASKL